MVKFLIAVLAIAIILLQLQVDSLRRKLKEDHDVLMQVTGADND